jgi:regulator of replication initiation timing
MQAAEGRRRLKRTNDELQQKITRLRAERDRLRTDVQQLVRVVHVLEVENQQLRAAADSDGVVRVLPGQHRPSTR